MRQTGRQQIVSRSAARGWPGPNFLTFIRSLRVRVEYSPDAAAADRSPAAERPGGDWPRCTDPGRVSQQSFLSRIRIDLNSLWQRTCRIRRIVASGAAGVTLVPFGSDCSEKGWNSGMRRCVGMSAWIGNVPWMAHITARICFHRAFFPTIR